ncbi:ElyC/SanA/YdcF family protein [Actinopolymorpha sp. B11F2]|uniref:ElyC/SanA/YdcF family protein n=1 Tax=Actinopolymorpha sp. B11F2 TaxID=3160862 RepID=UPI0032E4C3E9
MFTGANSADTLTWFPRGEAVQNGESAIELGVPAEAVLIEREATNTGQNISRSRELLTDAGVTVDSVMLISMPYMQRRKGP